MHTCHNCSYENRPGVVFCENCGTSLIGSSASIETQMITEDEVMEDVPPISELKAAIESSEAAEPPEAGTATFPEEGLLRLEISETTNPIIMVIEKSVMFGRRDATAGSMPDVDLTPYAGYRMGVSRRHAEIRLDQETRQLNIWDLGSSNGTFLNGDRLISHRPYTVSDGDSVRFGQLGVKVRFERKVDSKGGKKPGTNEDAPAKD